MNHIPGGIPAQHLTWQILCRIEPHLIDLERFAERCNSRDWREYEEIKRSTQLLVGCGRNHPVLGTSDAYDIAHRHLCKLGGW